MYIVMPHGHSDLMRDHKNNAMSEKKTGPVRMVDGVPVPEVPLEQLILMLEIYLQTAGDTLRQRPRDRTVIFLTTLSGNSLAYLRLLHDNVKGLENARDAFMLEQLKNFSAIGRPQ